MLAEEPEAREEGDEEDEARGEATNRRTRSLTRILRGEMTPCAFNEVREGESHAPARIAPRGPATLTSAAGPRILVFP